MTSGICQVKENRKRGRLISFFLSCFDRTLNTPLQAAREIENTHPTPLGTQNSRSFHCCSIDRLWQLNTAQYTCFIAFLESLYRVSESEADVTFPVRDCFSIQPVGNLKPIGGNARRRRLLFQTPLRNFKPSLFQKIHRLRNDMYTKRGALFAFNSQRL